MCRKNTSIKNENIEGKQNSAQKEDNSMFNILYTDANGNISTGQLQSNKLVQSNSVGQLQSYTEAGPQYLHVTHNKNQQALNNQPYPFPNVVLSTGYITQPTAQTFLLPANNMYKCTAVIGPPTTTRISSNVCFIWYLSGVGTFGSPGTMNTSFYTTPAVGYIKTTTSATIYLLITTGTQPTLLGADVGAFVATYATIDLLI